MATSLWTTSCDIYRPFAGSLVASNVPCRLVPDMINGQSATGLAWTDYIDLPADTDIRDGCTRNDRAPTVAFDDGDEVRVPSGSNTRYVVVWVEWHNVGGPMSFTRAYLTRHDAAWDDR
jgi:hypothetical protein